MEGLRCRAAQPKACLQTSNFSPPLPPQGKFRLGGNK
jgi:hypothetical protein